MNQIVTQGIVLARIDYGEADRIITLLTPDQGKLRLMARGVRKAKSKLAGGIELFSVSQITFIRGKGDIGTLISTRLVKHYGNIISRIERVQLGYELIKQLDKATEDEPESDYFALLQQAFAALDQPAVHAQIITLWFQAGLLRLAGLSPNLMYDGSGAKLSAESRYDFSLADGMFVRLSEGQYDARAIKFLRLLFEQHSPSDLMRIDCVAQLSEQVSGLVAAWRRQYL